MNETDRYLQTRASPSGPPILDCQLRPADTPADIASITHLTALSPKLAKTTVGEVNDLYSTLHDYLTANFYYSPATLIPFGYDWRLSIRRLQERDGIFERMRKEMEQREGGIVVAHSMGNLVFRGFLRHLWYVFYDESKAQESSESNESAADPSEDPSPQPWGISNTSSLCSTRCSARNPHHRLPLTTAASPRLV